MIFSTIARFFDCNGFRWISQLLAFTAYVMKGGQIRFVRYNKRFKLWEYKVGDSIFLTLSPSWFSSSAYYLQTLRKYSANKYLPKEGDVVIDIGAGIGEEVLPLSHLVGVSGKVYAVEANPDTYKVLEYICERNQLTNTTILNLALADKNDFLFIEDDNRFGVKNTVSKVHTGKEQFKVRAVSLDWFIEENNIKVVDFLKVNIEGAEQIIIKGMKNSLGKIKNVAISCHDFRYENGESEFYKTHDKVVAYLQEHNFLITRQQTGDRVIDNYVYGFNANLQA